MAVSPALTYPSKTYHMGNGLSLEALTTVVAKRRATLLAWSFIEPMAHLVAPRLIYRSIVAALMTDSGLYGATRTVSSRRTLLIRNSLIRMRGFPIPYLARTTTRPPYGEQWPRFAQYGSTQ